jgi:poly(glycerol-phosphate) alpha-glucosyltransferase
MLDRWALQNSSWKKRLAWMAYEQRHLRGASCLRALCDAEAKDIRRLGFSAPICVIPNGVDLPQLRAAVAAPKYKPTAFFSNQKVLLYLGRIHPKKGLRPLLEAWAKARSREPWVLIIAGWDQGRYAVQLKRMASDLGLPWSEMQETPQLDRSVVFTGPLFGRAKQDWLRRCDAFVLPSLSEGLPMAVLEAWAFAKPVLMSSHCNLAEGFRARAAILIEPTRRGIAEGLRELFATPEASLKAAGLRGRTLVERSFTWPRAAAELNSVYRWMLGSGPKPQCIINY